MAGFVFDLSLTVQPASDTLLADVWELIGCDNGGPDRCKGVEGLHESKNVHKWCRHCRDWTKPEM